MPQSDASGLEPQKPISSYRSDSSRTPGSFSRAFLAALIVGAIGLGIAYGIETGFFREAVAVYNANQPPIQEPGPWYQWNYS